MHTSTCFFDAVYLLDVPRYQDERGWFSESLKQKPYAELLNLAPSNNEPFVQSNVSHSKLNVLRGLHAQIQHPQGKLIQVLSGRVFDVFVDIRRGSPTFGQHQHVVLDASLSQQLWIPPGFAHGFLTLADDSIVLYHCTDYYHAHDQVTLLWNDGDVNIEWPHTGHHPILSDKDALGISLKELASCVS